MDRRVTGAVPVATLLSPVVLWSSASEPAATLLLPSVRLGITERPRPTLSVPVKVALKSRLVSPAAALLLSSK